MVSGKIVAEELQDKLELHEDWSIHPARDTHGYTTELILGEVTEEKAIIEVVRGGVTDIHVYHQDAPNWGGVSMDGVPGRVSDTTLDSWDEAVEIVQFLADEDTLQEVMELAFSEETGKRDPLMNAVNKLRD